MSKLTVKLNSSGVRQMLRSPEMEALLKERAQNIVSGLGEGYDSTTYSGKNRANASIRATSWAAYRNELKNNTILKALR